MFKTLISTLVILTLSCAVQAQKPAALDKGEATEANLRKIRERSRSPELEAQQKEIDADRQKKLDALLEKYPVQKYPVQPKPVAKKPAVKKPAPPEPVVKTASIAVEIETPAKTATTKPVIRDRNVRPASVAVEPQKAAAGRQGPGGQDSIEVLLKDVRTLLFDLIQRVDRIEKRLAG
jgi:hypothetical protein